MEGGRDRGGGGGKVVEGEVGNWGVEGEGAGGVDVVFEIVGRLSYLMEREGRKEGRG